MSNNDGDDDLEERKGDVWSMDEVRSGDAESSKVSEISDTSDRSDDESSDTTSDPEETSDTTDASDMTDTTGSADASDTESKIDDSAGEADGETVRQMALNADAKGIVVRDLHNVNVYIYESVYREMRVKYKELDTEYFATHGEDLSKNKDFFNAVFRAGLRSPQLEEELEID